MVRTVLLAIGIADPPLSVPVSTSPRCRAGGRRIFTKAMLHLSLVMLAGLGQTSALGAVPLMAHALRDHTSEPAAYDAIDAYIQQHVDRLQVPGAALAIVEGDRIVHQRGFGQAGPDGTPPSPQTPFFIGSLTKSFTALAVMQLVEEGKVALDAPVQWYLPSFRVADPDASARMTVRQLLNQTSGLSQVAGIRPLADFDQSAGASERQARALATVELTRPVGAAFEYSNMNYFLLGLIVEAASEESYAAYRQDHIFTPLEMRHSYITRTEAQQHGLALGYRYWFAHPVADPDQPSPLGSLAAGQVISSTEDMAHWLIAQLHDGRYDSIQILYPAGIAEMHRPAVEANLGLAQGRYGMGWFMEDQDRTRTISHYGVVPDFYAYMAILPEQEKGFLLLLNADHLLMTTALEEVGRGATARLAGQQPDPVRWGVIIPWALRGLLVLPALQILGVAILLRRVRRWRRHPESQPAPGRMWVLHIGFPMLLNLLLAATPALLFASGLAGMLFVYAPDVSWIALLCGGFAVIWMFARTGLILWTLQGARRQHPSVARLLPTAWP